MAQLELRGVTKAYPGGIDAAVGVDLTVKDGELFVIVGPSGSGKSTLLRLVAGLETLDSGSIALGGRRIDGLTPSDRDVAMVFQDQVLYPHLNTFENIAFGLRARGVAKAEVVERVGATASMLGLSDYLDRPPGTLSGGQRRRVALGRALVLRPGLFLFDEPFSGLDAPLRATTRAELVDLNRKFGATMVLVTHDQGEALALGNRIAVIDQGRVVQVGRPIDLYNHPANRFVARFFGQPPMNLLPCKIDKGGPQPTIQIQGLDDLGPWSLDLTRGWASRLIDVKPSQLEVGLRPEQLMLRPASDFHPNPSIPTGLATIKRLEPIGHETLAYLSFGPQELTARLSPRSDFQVNDQVVFDLDFERANWFAGLSGDRLAVDPLADGGGGAP